jgi:hypothetical protein
VSAGVLGPERPMQITVWNWPGDTDGHGEPIPRIIYDGPEQDYDHR